ncbi:NAD(P)-binding protein, partial [Rhizopogon salebrosus TDB-379]
KVVCITGSSRGIGRACAIESAKHGATGLILHYFGDQETEAELQSLKVEINATSRNNCRVVGHSHVTSISEVYGVSHRFASRIVRTFKLSHVLVSNAGICPFAEFLTMPHATWERTRQVNLDGSFYVVQAVANQMKNQVPQGGSIIGLASISALVGGEFQCHYTPTKAGILSMMQSCAVALGKYNIRCNAILPGTIATDINKEDLANEEKQEYTIKRTALGRLGAPDDIAGPMVFLASDLAKYVTGAQLLVDGGLFVNLQ